MNNVREQEDEKLSLLDHPPLYDDSLSWKEKIIGFFVFCLLAAYALFLAYAFVRWIIRPLIQWLK